MATISPESNEKSRSRKIKKVAKSVPPVPLFLLDLNTSLSSFLFYSPKPFCASPQSTRIFKYTRRILERNTGWKRISVTLLSFLVFKSCLIPAPMSYKTALCYKLTKIFPNTIAGPQRVTLPLEPRLFLAGGRQSWAALSKFTHSENPPCKRVRHWNFCDGSHALSHTTQGLDTGKGVSLSLSLFKFQSG